MASKFSGTKIYSSTFMVKHHGEVDALGGTAELRKLLRGQQANVHVYVVQGMITQLSFWIVKKSMKQISTRDFDIMQPDNALWMPECEKTPHKHN